MKRTCTDRGMKKSVLRKMKSYCKGHQSFNLRGPRSSLEGEDTSKKSGVIHIL